MKPKISIITVTYNAMKTIRYTIESVAGQTYKNIEYIIIDGGSTDRTVDIIKEYGDKISYWISEPDKGIYDAFNKGVVASTGDYIQFLGADDCLLDANIIEKLSEEITPDIDVISAGVYGVDEDCICEKYIGNEILSDQTVYDGGMLPHQGLFVKRGLLIKYPFDLKYKIASDYDNLLKLLFDKEVKFKYVSWAVVYYSLSGVSSATEKAMAENFEIEGCYRLHRTEKDFADYLRKQIGLRGTIKRFLKMISLFMPVKKVINLYFRGWRKHHCKWEHCRWCGR